MVQTDTRARYSACLQFVFRPLLCPLHVKETFAPTVKSSAARMPYFCFDDDGSFSMQQPRFGINPDRRLTEMSPCKGDLSLWGTHVSATSQISADGAAADLSDGPDTKIVPSHVECCSGSDAACCWGHDWHSWREGEWAGSQEIETSITCVRCTHQSSLNVGAKLQRTFCIQ